MTGPSNRRTADDVRAAVERLVQARRSEAIGWLQDLVAIDSEAPRERAAQEKVVEIATSLGLEARLVDSDHDGKLASHPRFVETGMPYENRPNCVVTIPAAASGALLCNAHIDTVAVGEGWTRDPYGELDAGRLHGRGSCDTKASLVSALLAAACLTELEGATFAPIEIHSVVDEEPGGNGTLGMLRARGSAFRAAPPRLAVVMEPTRLDLLYGHRGMLWYSVACIGKQAHGSTPLGVNAIEHAAALIQRLKALNSDFATWAGGAYDPPRLNVGIIHGGHEVYTTPGSCTVDVSVRYAPGQRDAVAGAFLAAVGAGSPEERAEILFCRDFAASQTPIDTPELAGMLTVLRGVRPKAVATTLTGTCDMRHYRDELGVPAVIFGPGDLQVAHTPHEFVDVDEMLLAARVLAELALSLGPSPDQPRGQ